ncbi:MAG: DNA integrity scanning protein DisA nucleotide-binding domain protein [Desulfosarcina sp.]|nr:DNA integrity scanning protein DisA nucleotide-binding domain protein [Desulfosarcina sp.]MBC2741801.1 DNA integrity scanning protein DisA nucleotide-binding domain protein [Desulfosarcina sp.]MBC2764715.1 DNA-binding protein [Desulfosarcina sp.]
MSDGPFSESENLRNINVNINAFTCHCIGDTLDGLRDGLSHFSGPSRAAIVFAMGPEQPMFVFDPQNLLSGHEPRLKELYMENQAWRKHLPIQRGSLKYSHIIREKNLQLAGLISHGGRSGSVYYQMWFTEHHPDMCSTGPTERWMEHAAWRFSHDMASESVFYTGISGSFLREYATHAVRDDVVDRMNVLLGWDTKLRIYPILDAILEISRTMEEGAWPRGKLVFVEPKALAHIPFLAQFSHSEQPAMENIKHVRKLLAAVEQSDLKLISDGRCVAGIADDNLPDFFITADFNGRHGFLRVVDDTVCSFADGTYQSTTRRANLVHLEEVLLESDLDPETGNTVYKIITALVHQAEDQKHGATLVLDLNPSPVAISGQCFGRPLDLREPAILDLAKSLFRVDGALHIGADLHLHGFACLLDGRAIMGENRARGARYNSALRFTAEHENIIVVVVSSDRPVSIIQSGIEISAACQWKPMSCRIVQPVPLDQWVDSNGD